MKTFLKWFGGVLVVGLLSLLGLVSWFLYAPTDYAARLASVERQAQAGVEAQRWAGVMWAVVAPGGVLETGASGFANIESAQMMTPDTIMPIGSISKVLVGLAGAWAISEGDLDPDQPITDILSIPFDAPDGRARSFAQLATHTASLVDIDPVYEVAGYDYTTPTHPVPLAEFLASALGTSGSLYDEASFLDAAPGTQYSYSNIGAALAAQVIADAMERDFADLTQETIVKPLGLSGFWGHLRPPGADNATLYTRDADGAFVAIPPYGLATWPDGQFNASVSDLARLLAVMMNGGRYGSDQVLPADHVALVTEPRVSGLSGLQGDGDFVGLFWTRETIAIGPLVMQFEGHSGGDPGVITFMYRDPEAPTGFVLMFNSDERNMRDVMAMVRLARTLAGMPMPPSRDP